MSELMTMPNERPLPVLRQELNLERSAPSRSGESSWVIYDPLQHRFIQVDTVAKDLLSIWNEAKTPGALLQMASKRFGLVLDAADISQLAAFVEKNHLAVEGNDRGWKDAYAMARSQERSWIMQLLHNYLYFRIPLFRPHDWLRANLKYVAPLYTRPAALAIVLLGLAGLYFVSRQWDEFLSTFPNFFTLEGMLTFSTALFFVKGLHELGHAFTAMRFGCRVPTMGIALMVMVPMLYTDVSDAWRLKNRRERFLIGAAGVMVEIAIACLATFLWVFLPDGILRSVVFVLATTSWMMSLFLNLNPFMRFDGYYLLSDAAGIDNLQPRSFALGRWKLRELLFAPGTPCPEVLPAVTRRWLIIYAWTTWIYRFIVFTGIALLVYHYFFKALGLILFAVEIWFFVALPVVGEVMEWRRSQFPHVSRRRMVISFGVLGSAALLFVFPWSQSVYVPAVLEASDSVRVFPPRPAQIETVLVQPGQTVEKGALLVQLSSPDVDGEIWRAEIALDGTRLRLARTMSDLRDKEQRLVLLHEFDAIQSKLAGLKREKEELAVRAPAGGKVLELERKLHPGRWISKDTLIGVIGAQKSFSAKGYLPEEDVIRIAPGTEGTFVPDDIMRPAYPVRVASIAQSGASAIEVVALASQYGGRVGVEPDEAGLLVPVQSQFLLELAAVGPGEGVHEQEVRGMVKLEGAPRSFAGRVWRQVARVLVRESGF